MTTTPTTTDTAASFGPELFAFLADLRENNDRDWFAANRERYEAEVLEPALAFVEDFGYRLQSISPHMRAEPRRSGGSLFRIHRDTRFSKDKSPYKTNLGIHFRHERGKDAHAPGFYLHLEPGQVFAGGGIWHPDTATANAIREAIVARPGRWKEATRTPPFAGTLELGAADNALKRVPRGFDPDHELGDDLRRRDFFGWARLDEAAATAPDFLDRYTRICESASPLMRFLCDVSGLPY